MTLNPKIEPILIVHGGAWDIPKMLHNAHLEGIDQALTIGQSVLAGTNDPVKTVIAVIKYLENNPTFNAGKGSFLNAAGEVEMDAGIMVGKDLSVGAVAAIQNVPHPIEVANLVRTATKHIFLVGEGATNFARSQNIKMIPTEALLTGREKKLYEDLKAQNKVRIKSNFEIEDQGRDTVGAVVINDRGELAAGTSTGGIPFKMQGRVSDCPVIGSGFYANDLIGGASATGLGEGIMRVMLAKTAIDYLRDGGSVQKAANAAVSVLKDQVDGEGGIILIDKNAQPGFAFNTPYMAVGAAKLHKKLFISLGENSK